jgi:threonine synthase|tara:strand:- start:1002 stop:2255 length:1254 start_codon:yes stop_codon:yes gene_type:complete
VTNVTCLKCRNCGDKYEIQPISICEECFGPLEVEYDFEQIRENVTKRDIENGPKSLWRYKELLPVGDKIVDLNPGFTPLHKADNLANKLGLKDLYIKNDSVNPTFSFKDRVVAVSVSKALEFGFDTLACASTGNLANSVAAHAAKGKLNCYIFIPSDLNMGKVIQTLAYGPNLISVDGNYDDVNRLCTEVAGYYNWAFVNINLRPYYSEGSKTLGYEVIEQLGWETPDRAIIPVGSGSLLTKIWKGYHEFLDLDLVDEVQTKITASQSEGCSPIVTAFESGSDIKSVKPNTIEKSLAIGNPADGYYALRVLKDSDGTAAAGSDNDIIDGIKLLAKTEGIFTETAGGVVMSTLKKLVERGEIDKDEKTVIYITGNGLKTQDVLSNYIPKGIRINPDLKEFNNILDTKFAKKKIKKEAI